MPGPCGGVDHTHQDSGPTGAPGPRRTDPVRTAAAGQRGAKKEDEATPLTISSQMSPSFAEMVLNDSSSKYINLELDGATQQLRWLCDVLLPLVNLNGYSANSLPASLLDTNLFPQVQAVQGTNQQSQYAATYKRASVLMNQLRIGLDYYGVPYNRVPLLSESFLTDTLRTASDYAVNIEQYAQAYRAAKQAKATQTDSLSAGLKKASQAIDAKKQQIVDLNKNQGDIQDAIQGLAATRNKLWSELQTADADFKSALERQGEGCQFQDILAIGAAVATVVATGGSALAAIGPAMGALQKSPQKYPNGKTVGDDFSGFKYRVSEVADAGTDAASFLGAINTLGSKIKATGTHDTGFDLPSDEAKIVSGAADFEDRLKPFLSMAEGSKLDSALRSFVSVCEARNNKIIEFNQNELQLTALAAEIQQTQADADSIQDSIAATQDPFIPQASAFMDRAWIESKRDLVRMIYQLERAHRYSTLEDVSSLKIEDFSAVALQTTLFQLQQSYSDTLQSVKRSSRLHDLVVDATLYLSAETMKRFQETGDVVVPIPYTDASLCDKCNVYVTEVAIVLEDENGIVRDFAATIEHFGRSPVFDADGKLHLFSHQPVSIDFERQNGEVVLRAQLAASPNLVGVSPYGPWGITLKPSSGKRPKAIRVRLVMQGYARLRTASCTRA